MYLFKVTIITCLIFLLFSCSLLPQSNHREKADIVVVDKSSREMLLLNKEGEVIDEFKIALGENPVGHKVKEWDERTPEGLYKIEYRNPESKFYRSLKVSYPNEIDVVEASFKGLSPGGDIFIHGADNKDNWFKAILKQMKFDNWTDGCIAVNNFEMDRIWHTVPDGTEVLILN